MKKLLLLSTVLLGAVSASQAGVHFNIGLGLPLPPLPGVVIGHRCPAPVVVAPAPAPVYVEPAPIYAPPPVCSAPAPEVYSAPPVVYSAPPVVYAPPVVVEPSVSFGFRFGGYRHYGGYGGYHHYGYGGSYSHGGWGHRGWGYGYRR
jgi:hypothetical protein